MRRDAIVCVVAVGIVVAGGCAAWTQTPAASRTIAPAVAFPKPTSPAQSAEPTEGGRLHGIVKSGSTPLPGVTVTAQNTLAGKRYSTTTDIAGAWSLTIPVNGRYVIRTQFAAFAQGSQEALLNASNRDQTVAFDLMLASRAPHLDQEQGAPYEQALQAIRQLAGSGAQNLNLLSALMGDTENQNNASGMSMRGAALPSIAGNSDFSEDSVAISGQTGQVSPLAGLDIDRIRDAIETMRLQTGGQGGSEGRQGVLVLGGPGGFNMAMGGGPGGGFMGGPRDFGGGRTIFRNFNPAQPHGAIFWMGSNSALDALPFALNGQPQVRPASGTNRFGITFISAHLPCPISPSPAAKIPSSSVFPARATRARWISTPLCPRMPSAAATSPLPACRPSTIRPTTPVAACSARRPGNPSPATSFLRSASPHPPPRCFAAAPPSRKSSPSRTSPPPPPTATTITCSPPRKPTIRGWAFATCACWARAPVCWEAAASAAGRSRVRGLRQNLNFNYNWSRSAEDNVNLFPQLGGNSSTGSNSLQAGYTLGYNKVTSIFNANWNRSNLQTLNYFTGGPDVATQAGILGPDGAALNANPLDYGLPSITLVQFAGLSQQQPNFSLSQNHLHRRDPQLAARQAQHPLRRRLPPCPSRLPRRLKLHRLLHLQRQIHAGSRGISCHRLRPRRLPSWPPTRNGH